MQTILASYLNALKAIYASGYATDERSYYPALATFLTAIGETLNPKIIALHETADRGEGHPDFLLQVQNTGDLRAAIEVKPTGADVSALIQTQQVRDYLRGYGLVLVTNLREFALVQPGRGGLPEVVMRYALSDDEGEFWHTGTRTLVQAHAERFADFMASVLTWDVPITRPDVLAETLARYAREALRRMEAQPAANLAPLKEALTNALGIHFTGEDGEHFFRSSLVQTLFYGLFSSWVVWNQRGAYEPFRWQNAGDNLSLPIVRELFERIAIGHQLEALNIRKPLEWAENALCRTAWDSFSTAFLHRDGTINPINFFYEPFLAAFDPELRKRLGVWYTPPEVVQYMVARVDKVLRDELGIDRGLADPRVVVLDPACGTGAYVVEVLRRIAESLPDDGLRAAELRQAATRRVYGFEILPAPFIVAHLQVGMLFSELGISLQNSRAGIYLTNSLTGWYRGEQQNALPGFPALAREAEAASHVKLDEEILVILGNPPYDGYAGMAVEEERELSNAYRTTVRAPRPQGQGLNDLYVRFYRMAERQIVEETGQGVVCFISNYSWLDGLSFTGMRERYLEVFDKIWIDNLNGDKFRTGKLTPWGEPDPSIFSTPHNREGIQVGTAIGLLVRTENDHEESLVGYRSLWGTQKREELLATLNQPDSELYETIHPPLELGLPFYPASVEASYFTWPLLPDLFPVSFPGVKTSRDDVLVEIDRDKLEARMRLYFDPSKSDDEIAALAPRLMETTSRFDARAARAYLLERGFLPENIVRYCYRPYDVRWLYWEPETKLLDEKRAEYVPHVFDGNVWLEARQKQSKEGFDRGYVVSVLADNFGSGLSSFFPLYLRSWPDAGSLFGAQSEIRPNLTTEANQYLDKLGLRETDLFYHTVGILHSPTYRGENANALRQDWPRIPLPDNADLLRTSAKLGRTIAVLLDGDKPIPDDLPDFVLDVLPSIAVPQRVDGGQLDPNRDLNINVNWGYFGQAGVTMPGRGKTEAHPASPPYDILGETVFDVFLNDRAYWRNVPAQVWNYTLGGYQVIKKWLSYRETDILGRPLRVEEVRMVQGIAQRIAAILLLAPQLNENYELVKRNLR